MKESTVHMILLSIVVYSRGRFSVLGALERDRNGNLLEHFSSLLSSFHGAVFCGQFCSPVGVDLIKLITRDDFTLIVRSFQTPGLMFPGDRLVLCNVSTQLKLICIFTGPPLACPALRPSPVYRT